MRTSSLIGMLLVCCVATASDRTAEIRLRDGNILYVDVLQDYFEVKTKYGLLKVPLADVQAINFGFRLSAANKLKVAAALKKLGSKNYRERENAAKMLIRMGQLGYTPAWMSQNDKDLEVAKRAQEIAKVIGAGHAPDDLIVRTTDVLQTTEFDIVGAIVGESIKFQSSTLGDLTVKIQDLRSLQFVSQKASVVKIRAGKHEKPDWLDTKVKIRTGVVVMFNAQGAVDLWPQGPGQYVCGPRGYKQNGRNSSRPAGALLGKIGKDGREFVIGDHLQFLADKQGTLRVAIVPSPWNNTSTGNYTLNVKLGFLNKAR